MGGEARRSAELRTGSVAGEATSDRPGSPAASVTLTVDGRASAAPESVDLLDGGE